MSNAQPDGGSAFPCGENVTMGQCEPSPGMSLRDYFAANVVVTEDEIHDACYCRGFSVPVPLSVRCECDAALRYQKADAMLRAREVKS